MNLKLMHSKWKAGSKLAPKDSVLVFVIAYAQAGSSTGYHPDTTSRQLGLARLSSSQNLSHGTPAPLTCKTIMSPLCL